LTRDWRCATRFVARRSDVRKNILKKLWKTCRKLVSKIFYFWGYYKKENIKIYRRLSKLNYIQIFKEHNVDLLSNKKGNVDSNLVFEIMKKAVSKSKFNKILLVSGDGDYKKLINYYLFILIVGYGFINISNNLFKNNYRYLNFFK
jgi:uncharacterized LabA/DUF88 family protein